ncbi:MAG: hypothetical protein ABIQ04_04590 [Candidatus Saccharimonadales bacterium]
MASESLATPTIGTASGGSQSYTLRASNASSSQTPVSLFTANISGSPGSMTIAVTFSGTSGWHNLTVERWSGAVLAGTPAANENITGGTAPSSTLTTTGTNSILSWISADWNAVAPGAPAYRSSAVQEDFFDKSGTGSYVTYSAYQGANTPGSQTYGLTSPSGQKPTMAAIEIQAAAPISNTLGWYKF